MGSIVRGEDSGACLLANWQPRATAALEERRDSILATMAQHAAMAESWSREDGEQESLLEARVLVLLKGAEDVSYRT